MEVARIRPLADIAKAPIVKNHTYTFTRITQLFKGISPPRHEPVEISPAQKLAPEDSVQVSNPIAEIHSWIRTAAIELESLAQADTNAKTGIEAATEQNGSLQPSLSTQVQELTPLPTINRNQKISTTAVNAPISSDMQSQLNVPTLITSNDEVDGELQGASQVQIDELSPVETQVQTATLVPATLPSQNHATVPLDPSHQATEASNNTQLSSLPQSNVVSSGAHTVIKGHRAISIGGQLQVMPTMPIPETFFKRYRLTIEPRLIDEIAQCFRKEVCLPELWMVRNKAGKAEPSIVLTCWDPRRCGNAMDREKLRHKLQRKVRKLQTLHESNLPCVVYIDNICLLGAMIRQENIRYKYLSTRYINGAEEFATTGLPLYDSNRKKLCTLGGCITDGRNIYGLTVEHALRDHLQEVSYTEDVESTASMTESEDSDSSEWEEPAPIEGQDFSPRGTANTVDNFEQAQSVNGTPEDVYTYVSSVQVVSASDALKGLTSSQSYTDWALLELSKYVWTAFGKGGNSYKHHGNGNCETIQGVLEEINAGLEVEVILDGVTVQGTIGQRLVPLTLQGRRFKVTQILLETPLNPGSSGCWVVRGNLVVGVIIAGRNQLPISYFIPFRDIITEISNELKSPFEIYRPTEIDPHAKALVNEISRIAESVQPYPEMDPKPMTVIPVQANNSPSYLGQTAVVLPDVYINRPSINLPRYAHEYFTISSNFPHSRYREEFNTSMKYSSPTEFSTTVNSVEMPTLGVSSTDHQNNNVQLVRRNHRRRAVKKQYCGIPLWASALVLVIIVLAIGLGVGLGIGLKHNRASSTQPSTPAASSGGLSRSAKIGIGLGVGVGFGLALITWGLIFFMFRGSKRKASRILVS